MNQKQQFLGIRHQKKRGMQETGRKTCTCGGHGIGLRPGTWSCKCRGGRAQWCSPAPPTHLTLPPSATPNPTHPSLAPPPSPFDQLPEFMQRRAAKATAHALDRSAVRPPRRQFGFQLELNNKQGIDGSCLGLSSSWD